MAIYPHIPIIYIRYTRESHYPHPPSRVTPAPRGYSRLQNTTPSRVAPRTPPPPRGYSHLPPSSRVAQSTNILTCITGCLSTSWIPAPTKHRPHHHGYSHLKDTAAPRVARAQHPPSLAVSSVHEYSPPASRVATHTTPPQPHRYSHLQNTSPPSRVAPTPHGYPHLQNTPQPHRYSHQ